MNYLIENSFLYENEINFWKIFKIKILFIGIQVLAIYIWCFMRTVLHIYNIFRVDPYMY